MCLHPGSQDVGKLESRAWLAQNPGSNNAYILILFKKKYLQIKKYQYYIIDNMRHTINKAVFTFISVLAAVLTSLSLFSAEHGRTVKAGPGSYGAQVNRLKPGDTLSLAAGTYTKGFRITGVKGTVEKPIIIRGPDRGKRARFTGRSGHNTVEISGCAYLEIRNLEVDSNNLPGVFGISGGGHSHHITIENCIIKNHASGQMTVGISTTGSAVWNWTIRGNVITTAGTGIYLGNSDGINPFIAGVIEYNLITDTIGYNMQIKHQNDRPALPGMPAETVTVIRHNVFSKVSQPKGKSEGKRPCLLVGHFPNTGRGAKDRYLIYGNFFYENSSGESLFQGEGNIAFYNNVLWNSSGPGIRIQRHNDRPKMIRIFQNTVVTKGSGITVSGGDRQFKQIVCANAVFADRPIRGGHAFSNITGPFNAAGRYLLSPDGGPGVMDLYPKPKKLSGSPYDPKDVSMFPDWNLDFNGHPRRNVFRGAYAGEGINRGWKLKLERKPVRERFDALAETGEFTHCADIVKTIVQGQKLGYALREIRSRLRDPEKDVREEAEKLFKALNGYADELMNRAADLKKSDPAASLAKYREIARLFAGDEVGRKAGREARALENHPRVREERQARHIWDQIRAYSEKLKPYNGKRDPGSSGFRRLNSRAIRALVRECNNLLRRYPDTSVVPQVKAFIERYTKR